MEPEVGTEKKGVRVAILQAPALVQKISFLGSNCPLNKNVIFLKKSVNAAEMSERKIVVSAFKVSATGKVILKHSLLKTDRVPQVTTMVSKIF